MLFHRAIDTRPASSSLDVRYMRGADVGSDHFLVRVKFRANGSSRREDHQHEKRSYRSSKINGLSNGNN